VHALIVLQKMTSRTWIIALAIAVVVPLLGGALGCYNRTESLGPENVSWILMWSAPLVILCIIGSGIFGALRTSNRISSKRYRGLMLLDYIGCFVASLWFVDQVSGV
jgi:hypothetical protein